MNPTVRENKPAPIQKKLPIRVELVVRALEDAKDKGFQEIKAYCQEQSVLFETRVYDSYKSRHDRDEIVSLPAFHIYVNTMHEKTFYPAHRPYQIIADTVFEFKRKIQERQEKKGRWKKTLQRWWERFMALGERKTRMQKEEEFQEKIRRMSYQKEQEDFDRRIKSHRVQTWN